MDLMDTDSVDLQDLGILRAHSLGRIPKSWGTKYRVQDLHSSGESGSWQFPPDGVAQCQGRVL